MLGPLPRLRFVHLPCGSFLHFRSQWGQPSYPILNCMPFPMASLSLFCILLILFIVCIPFLERKFQRGQGFCLFYLLIYFHCLEHCQAHGRCSVNICWMNEWKRKQRSRVILAFMQFSVCGLLSLNEVDYIFLTFWFGLSMCNSESLWNYRHLSFGKQCLLKTMLSWVMFWMKGKL